MNVSCPDLEDYLALAAEVTGLDLVALLNATNLDLADSALHAPAAGFGDQDLYPDFVEKSAVLVVRLAKNHPLPDGNKRAAWVTLRLFIEVNDWQWSDYPSVDEAEQAVLSIASGDWDQERVAQWLRPRITPSSAA